MISATEKEKTASSLTVQCKFYSSGGWNETYASIKSLSDFRVSAVDEEEIVFNVCIKRFCILLYCKWKLSSSIRSFWNESACYAKSRIIPDPSGKLILPSFSYPITRQQCFPIQPTSQNSCVFHFDLKLKPITLYYERVLTFSDSGLQDTPHDQSAYTSVPKIKFSDLTYNSKDKASVDENGTLFELYEF